MCRPMIDMTGLRCGRLVVIRQAEVKRQYGGVYWLCKCDCGNEAIVKGSHLRSGGIKSCGCFHRENSRKNIIKAYTARKKHCETTNMSQKNPTMWVIPATKEPWRNGFFGMCTNCNYISKDIDIAPRYCGNCGKAMANSNMG